MSKIQMTETDALIKKGIPSPMFKTFEHSNFGFVSHFVFRASDFLIIRVPGDREPYFKLTPVQLMLKPHIPPLPSNPPVNIPARFLRAHPAPDR